MKCIDVGPRHAERLVFLSGLDVGLDQSEWQIPNSKHWCAPLEVDEARCHKPFCFGEGLQLTASVLRYLLSLYCNIDSSSKSGWDSLPALFVLCCQTHEAGSDSKTYQGIARCSVRERNVHMIYHIGSNGSFPCGLP